ncbi:MAG: cohesin domain-containing protein [Patescibacteria group bacterium]|jgi:hypothetical protein
MKIKLLAISVVIFLAYFVMVLAIRTEPAMAQGTGDLELSSSCTSACEVGSDLTVTVSAVASTSSIGAVEVNLNYDKTKLQYQSVSYFSGENDFADHFAETVNQDIAVIHVEAGKPGGLASGSGNVFAVSFKVLAAGSASVTAGPIDGANQDGRVNLTSNSLVVSCIVATVPDTIVDPPPTPAAVDVNEATPDVADTNTSAGSSTQKTKATTYSFSKSEVIFDKTTALPDGNDKICASILLKNYGKIVTSLKPTIKSESGIDLGKTTLSKTIWSVCATSKLAGSKRIKISVKNILIKDQVVVFAAPVTAPVTSVPAATETVEPVASISDITETIIQRLLSVKGGVSVASKNDILNRKGITNVDLVQISGTAEPGTKLKLYIHSPVLIEKEVTVGSDGKWSAEVGQTLTPGTHRVEAAVVDEYNTESDTRLITKFSVAKSKNNPVIITAISLFVLLSVGIFYFIRRKRKMQLMNQAQTPTVATPEQTPIPASLPQSETVVTAPSANLAPQNITTQSTAQPVGQVPAALPPTPPTPQSSTPDQQELVYQQNPEIK